MFTIVILSAALQTGQLPTVGTIEEVDAYAVQTEYLVLADLRAGNIDAAVARAGAMVDWQDRAAAMRSVAVHAFEAIDKPYHAVIEVACAQRLAGIGS